MNLHDDADRLWPFVEKQAARGQTLVNFEGSMCIAANAKGNMEFADLLSVWRTAPREKLQSLDPKLAKAFNLHLILVKGQFPLASRPGNAASPPDERAVAEECTLAAAMRQYVRIFEMSPQPCRPQGFNSRRGTDFDKEDFSGGSFVREVGEPAAAGA